MTHDHAEAKKLVAALADYPGADPAFLTEADIASLVSSYRALEAERDQYREALGGLVRWSAHVTEGDYDNDELDVLNRARASREGG